MMPFGSLVNVANVFSHFCVFGFLHSAQTPAIPKNSRSRTLISYFDFGPFLEAFHSKNDEAGTIHRFVANLSFQKFAVAIPSDLTLKRSFFGSLNPHRMSPSARSPSLFIQTTGWIEPGAQSSPRQNRPHPDRLLHRTPQRSSAYLPGA